MHGDRRKDKSGKDCIAGTDTMGQKHIGSVGWDSIVGRSYFLVDKCGLVA